MAIPLPYESSIDLADPLRWVLRYSNSFVTSSPPSDPFFEPIPEQIILPEFNSPVLTIQATTLVSPTFRYIGSLTQLTQVGLNNQTTQLAFRKVWAGTQTIFFRQDLEPPYTLRFKPNPKLKNASLLIWEYIP